jgi:hypothetical protein
MKVLAWYINPTDTKNKKQKYMFYAGIEKE